MVPVIGLLGFSMARYGFIAISELFRALERGGGATSPIIIPVKWGQNMSQELLSIIFNRKEYGYV
jgi:hypothetical protein